MPKESEIDVLHDAWCGKVTQDPDDPKAAAPLNICAGCKEGFPVPLVLVMNQPYCGGCVLKAGAFTLRLGAAALQSIFGKIGRKAKKHG